MFFAPLSAAVMKWSEGCPPKESVAGSQVSSNEPRRRKPSPQRGEDPIMNKHLFHHCPRRRRRSRRLRCKRSPRRGAASAPTAQGLQVLRDNRGGDREGAAVGRDSRARGARVLGRRRGGRQPGDEAWPLPLAQVDPAAPRPPGRSPPVRASTRSPSRRATAFSLSVNGSGKFNCNVIESEAAPSPTLNVPSGTTRTENLDAKGFVCVNFQ